MEDERGLLEARARRDRKHPSSGPGAGGWLQALEAVAGCLDARRAVMFGADLGSGAGNGARSRRRVVAIPRRSGRRPYVARVAPVARAEDSQDLNDLDEYPRWLLTIADPEADQPRPAPGELRDAYGLTPAEACLAAELSRGATVAEIAAHQDIAVDTARKRLKAVFEKTRTHRQAELVQRVLSDFGEL